MRSVLTFSGTPACWDWRVWFPSTARAPIAAAGHRAGSRSRTGSIRRSAGCRISSVEQREYPLAATFVPGSGSFIGAYQPCMWPPARAERSRAPGIGPAAAQPSTPTPASPGSSPALITAHGISESWGGSTSSGTRTARRSRAEVWINSGKITHPRARPGHEHLPRRPVPALDQGEEPRTPSVQPGAGSVRLQPVGTIATAWRGVCGGAFVPRQALCRRAAPDRFLFRRLGRPSKRKSGTIASARRRECRHWRPLQTG